MQSYLTLDEIKISLFNAFSSKLNLIPLCSTDEEFCFLKSLAENLQHTLCSSLKIVTKATCQMVSVDQGSNVILQTDISSTISRYIFKIYLGSKDVCLGTIIHHKTSQHPVKRDGIP